jgi:hypothetical protein
MAIIKQHVTARRIGPAKFSIGGRSCDGQRRSHERRKSPMSGAQGERSVRAIQPQIRPLMKKMWSRPPLPE